MNEKKRNRETSSSKFPFVVMTSLWPESDCPASDL